MAWHEYKESDIPALTTDQIHRVIARNTRIIDTMDYEARMSQTIDYDKHSAAKRVRELCNLELNKRGKK